MNPWYSFFRKYIGIIAGTLYGLVLRLVFNIDGFNSFTLFSVALSATRVGHFEGGLQFVEKVISWDRNRHIGFNISVVPATIRKTVFDQHEQVRSVKGCHHLPIV